MRKDTTKTNLFGAALVLMAVMFSSLPARGQYESFFGDNTWEYHITYLTNTPEDYLNYPPESQSPTPLNVYCRTYILKYSKHSVSGVTHHYYPFNDFQQWSHVYENADEGRLYVDTSGVGYNDHAGVLICDMSLNEGDTFVLKDPCHYSYSTPYDWLDDTIGDRAMIVDSVKYIAGRKTIFLSLIDHLDDYFFGTAYSDQLSNYNFSIRFIEGIGPTYGSLPGCRDPGSDLYPTFGLLLCMYKDDALVYMADETLGCTQTCVGVKDHPQVVMNLYPNPATQFVVLDMSTGEEMDGSVIVTDMLGRQCLQQKASGTSVRIPVADLPTGMYFLTYTDGTRTITRKFMRE